jgi:hypothetical protein
MTNRLFVHFDELRKHSGQKFDLPCKSKIGF